MPKDYLLQRLLDKYTKTKVTEDSEPAPDIPLEDLINTLKHSIHDSVNLHSSLDANGCIPSLGCPRAMSSPKVKHLFNNVLSTLPQGTRYLEIGCWEGGIFIPAMYNNNHIKPTVIDIFTDPNGVEDNKLDSCNTYELKYVHTCLGDTPINFEYGKMCKTQDLEPIKSIAYSVQIVRTKVFMKEKHIFCGKHGMYGPISKKAGMLVKTPEDIKIINAILHYHSSIGYYEGR